MEGNGAASSGMKKKFRFGPGVLVAAAFIGPGTVFTASNAGATYGLGLLWAVVAAVAGAIVLQSFGARLGIATGSGLGEYLRKSFADYPSVRLCVTGLVVLALGLGNAAFETGNLLGAAKGIEAVWGMDRRIWVLALAVVSAISVSVGAFTTLQRILVGMVVALSICFVAAALLTAPGSPRVSSPWSPVIDQQNLGLIIALIGTTIVPYNLFLHASSAAKNWQGVDKGEAMRQSTWDTVVAIVGGGLVTAAILLTASHAFYDRGVPLEDASQIATQIQPLLAGGASYGFAFGLFAAGLSSAITAPLATAFALCGLLGWETNLGASPFRAICLTVIAIGAVFACLFQSAPMQTIIIAQLANGVLLPFVAFVLVVAAWQMKRVLEMPAWWLAAGFLVAFATTCLALWKLAGIFLPN